MKIFPRQPSISNEIARRLDLARAEFDGCLRCAARRNCTFSSYSHPPQARLASVTISL